MVKAAKLAVIAVVAVLAFGLAAALGQGIAPVSRACACLVAGEPLTLTVKEQSPYVNSSYMLSMLQRLPMLLAVPLKATHWQYPLSQMGLGPLT